MRRDYKGEREKARGKKNDLSHVPSKRNEEIKSGTSGCGSFVVPYFQPATSTTDHLQCLTLAFESEYSCSAPPTLVCRDWLFSEVYDCSDWWLSAVTDDCLLWLLSAVTDDCCNWRVSAVTDNCVTDDCLLWLMTAVSNDCLLQRMIVCCDWWLRNWLLSAVTDIVYCHWWLRNWWLSALTDDCLQWLTIVCSD